MSKLTRVFQTFFGLNGATSHFGQFGSRASSSGTFTKDPASIQALSAFSNNGWLDAINSSNKAPFLEDMNSLHLLIFYQLCYGFQEGIPEWDPSTNYFQYSIVKNPGTFDLYGSLTDNNTNNALPNQTDNANWHYLTPPTTPAGVMAEFGGASPPFGWLLCDGTSYATATYPVLFTAIGYTWGGSGANFNVPDYRGRAGIGVGQGGGLTNRVLASILGEENHLLVVGEMPSHSHSVTDPGHIHTLGRDITQGSNHSAIFADDAVANTYPTSQVIENSTTGISINSNGGNGVHNNMQPSVVVTKIIKY